ncbi:HAD-IA family hydrolase [Rhodoblastus acidophilus]|uniref:Phosphoglycolate phosphatase n=2 Tax=Candidatus Rhodoblastus alkanivorans TaxID=2954117 RepID=A0ABS9Z9F6_9HYPH|nr:HAD-IA family hydrolase [Candidatus Rhodoblastus alkanivorans]MCI4679767.1 HAD-IA family hydrolase [Candidatus Rhodoblastus alkanivorans]MCI4684313.1 HAD-IA family hydrolase [Candidatus Rhodoblastus alkanivorans]MDI4641634.1 HAD-IA family hydrolase [Rhodoblastus acidophilus]
MKSDPVLYVFDLDGTLADTAGDLMGTLDHIMLGEGFAPTPLEDSRSLLGAGARALIVRALEAQDKEVSPERLNDMFERFLAHYETRIADESRLFPGVVEALDALEQRGGLFAVCTNKVERPAKLLLEKLGVADRFAFICGQDTFGIAKPDPRPLLKTIEAAGGEVRRAIMIGDSKTDIATARAAEVPVIAVDFGYTDLPVSEYAPDRIISHFSELPDAAAAFFAASEGGKDDVMAG